MLLFISLKISEEIHESEQWKVAYMKGSANEMYTATLSNSFNNLNFAQAAEYVASFIQCNSINAIQSMQFSIFF